MKILLLGSSGMLGQAIKKEFAGFENKVTGADRINADFCFDLTNDALLEKCIRDVVPDVVINTAASVDLEFCENNPGLAYQINGRMPGILANICSLMNIYLVHVSTDHFYSGDRDIKHKESDPVVLVNEYARTKYIGEQLALTHKNSLVVRTNIVGFRGYGKPTFVEWALNEGRQNHHFNLFTDFYTSSIHTNDFASILKDLIEKHPAGVYNLASSDVKNKKDFILELLKTIYGITPDYTETSVKNINGTKRAESLGLDTEKIEKLLGYQMPDLSETINSIRNEYTERTKHNEMQ